MTGTWSGRWSGRSCTCCCRPSGRCRVLDRRHDRPLDGRGGWVRAGWRARRRILVRGRPVMALSGASHTGPPPRPITPQSMISRPGLCAVPGGPEPDQVGPGLYRLGCAGRHLRRIRRALAVRTGPARAIDANLAMVAVVVLITASWTTDRAALIPTVIASGVFIGSTTRPLSRISLNIISRIGR